MSRHSERTRRRFRVERIEHLEPRLALSTMLYSVGSGKINEAQTTFFYDDHHGDQILFSPAPLKADPGTGTFFFNGDGVQVLLTPGSNKSPGTFFFNDGVKDTQILLNQSAGKSKTTAQSIVFDSGKGDVLVYAPLAGHPSKGGSWFFKDSSGTTLSYAPDPDKPDKAATWRFADSDGDVLNYAPIPNKPDKGASLSFADTFGEELVYSPNADHPSKGGSLFFLDSHGHALSQTLSVQKSASGDTFFFNNGHEQILFSTPGTDPKTFAFTDGNNEQIVLSQPGAKKGKGGVIFFYNGVASA